MSIDLKQFAGASVTPADDARLYNFLLSGKTGIVEGVEITHLGANQLKISSGWGVCCGRVFTVSEETVNAAVSASGEVKGRLLINIDVSADVPAIFVTQAAADLPQLVQEDINSSGTVYQMSLAEYTVDALALSNIAKTVVMLPYSEGTVVYTQQADTLTGSGTNGKFKATATGTYTAFTIGGVSYAVKAGSETEIELTSGVWYSFILDTEAKTINFKAGGAGLNFKIVGSTTQPTSPKENTIWIETDTEIGEWQFSAAQPATRADGTALQNGDVWIKTVAKSAVSFNALKKNGVHVYPNCANQYVNGKWVSVTAMIYQSGKWCDWETYLYKAPNEYNDLTGGWTASGYSYGSTAFNNNGVTKTETSITTKGVVNVNYGGCGTAKAINLTNYKQLVVTGKKNSTGSEHVFVSSTKNVSNVVARVYFDTTENELTISLDEINGNYYIGWLGDCTVKEVKLL